MFGAPAQLPDAPGHLGRLGRFALQRGLRLAASLLVWTLLAAFLSQGSPWAVAGCASAALLLWAPATWVLYRAAFEPGPPDPRLRDAEGRALCGDDMIGVVRAMSLEHALGGLPLLLAGAVAALRLGPMGVAAGVLAVTVVGVSAAQALFRMEYQVARIEGAMGRTGASRGRLQRLGRVALGRRRDTVQHTLARVCFLDGDIDASLAALRRIADPSTFHVAALRAQVLAGRDPDRALRALADPQLADDQRAIVEALVDLHTGRVDEVRQRSDRLLSLAEGAAHDVASVLRLLAAAAVAPHPRATELLAEGGWQPDRLPWLHRVWPAVAERLEGAVWPEPPRSD